jgi:hypothetical protein
MVSDVWEAISVSVPACACADLETTKTVDGFSEVCTPNSSPLFPCLIAGALTFEHPGSKILACFQCVIEVTLQLLQCYALSFFDTGRVTDVSLGGQLVARVKHLVFRFTCADFSEAESVKH